MGMIPDVRCRRCGETFSSLRSRCPNCGTRRVSQSGRTPATTPGTVKGTASYDRAETNTKWQMIFGLILVVAVILAVEIEKANIGKHSILIVGGAAMALKYEDERSTVDIDICFREQNKLYSCKMDETK